MNPLEPGRAAVLGLGIIGSRVVGQLVAGGWRVACWNRTPKGLPGEAASAMEAVAGAAVISLYLKDAPAVREVVAGLVPALKPGQILLNHSTVDLATTQWLDGVCRDCGCLFLDVPFTGSKLAAAGGQLVYYTGGDEDLVRRVEPYLRLSGKELLPCGEVGSATVVKLATNLISACTVQALAESLAIATRHGVAPERFIQAVKGNLCCSPLAGFKLPTMASGEFETHFSLDNMRKDSVYALDLAASAGLETPAIEAVSGRMTELCAEGHGGLDYSAMAKPYLAAP
jgi:3-hydroxyisobutyrate dehydrogenase/glyoxylate/succinic semialdehyde reductase